MNVNINTSLHGHYTIYNENMEVISESDNLITDWGMRRLTGDQTTGAPHLQPDDIAARAFWPNLCNIVVGTGNTPPSATDWQLTNIIPVTSYTDTNNNLTTGTTLSTDSSDNLLIIFTKMSRLQFNSTFVGTSAIKEVGCSWTPTFSASNRYGIFSRSVLDPSRIVNISANSVVYITYKLTISTNCHKIITTLNNTRYKGTGATDLPNNKTNVRRLPFYIMPADADITNATNISNYTLNQGLNGVTAASDDVNNPSEYNEYVQPLFEDIGLKNYVYSGSGRNTTSYSSIGTAPYQDNVFGTQIDDHSAYKIWWLQMYTSDWPTQGDNPSNRYSTFTSTTSSSLNNSISIAQPNLGGGGTDYSNAIQQNLSLFTGISASRTGRKPAEIVTGTLSKLNNNTWRWTVNFLLAPREFKNNTTWIKMYPATLGDWDNSGNGNFSTSYTYQDRVGGLDYGIVTVFDSAYTPPSNTYNGFTYSFTFTRASS